MPRYTHQAAFEFRKEEKPVWADNVVWLNIYRGDEKIGDMGLLAKKASMDCGIKNLSVMLFELDVLKLKPLISRTNKFTHLAAYPENDMTFPCSLTPMQYGVICMRQFLARRKPASSLRKQIS